MAEIISFNEFTEDITNMESEASMITTGNINTLRAALDEIFTEENVAGSALHGVSTLLTLGDEDFAILAPSVLQSFQQSINNPNDKILLTQALGVMGSNSDELMETFNRVSVELDTITTISVQKREFLRSILATIVNAIMDTEGISKRFVEVPVEVCREGVRLPEYANTSDSGMDVFALEDITINPGETKLIPTGLKFGLPPGYEIQVRPKSGRALKTKLRVANTPGTVDAGYRDEVCVIIENVEPPFKDISYEFNENGKIIINSIVHGSAYTIGKGEKFCQLVLSEVPKAALYLVEKVGEIGENRGGGFGSTGLK